MTSDLVLWVRRERGEGTLRAVIPWDKKTGDRIDTHARRAAGAGWHEMAVLWPSTDTRPAVDHRLSLMPGVVTRRRPRAEVAGLRSAP